MTAYDGDFLVTSLPVLNDVDGRDLRIDRADKYIRISPEMLTEIYDAAAHDATITDGVLRIVGINRTVAYRIGELDDDGREAWYQAERIDEE